MMMSFAGRGTGDGGRRVDRGSSAAEKPTMNTLLAMNMRLRYSGNIKERLETSDKRGKPGGRGGEAAQRKEKKGRSAGGQKKAKKEGKKRERQDRRERPREREREREREKKKKKREGEESVRAVGDMMEVGKSAKRQQQQKEG